LLIFSLTTPFLSNLSILFVIVPDAMCICSNNSLADSEWGCPVRSYAAKTLLVDGWTTDLPAKFFSLVGIGGYFSTRVGCM
jgi:hypothetical protein